MAGEAGGGIICDTAEVDYVSVTVHYTTASGVPSATTMLIGSGK